MLKYEAIVLGELQNNCYLLWESDSKEAVIIDAADDGQAISEEIERLHLIPKMILSTHGHFDHNLGVLDLKLIYNIPIGMNRKDWFLMERQKETAKFFLKREIKTPNLIKLDVDLEEINKIDLGKEVIHIIKSPGHTPGGVMFWVDNLLFTGDTIFAEGLRGDTSHSYSSVRDLFRSVCAAMKLPDKTIILPGHGEATSVGESRPLFSCDYCELN